VSVIIRTSFSGIEHDSEFSLVSRSSLALNPIPLAV